MSNWQLAIKEELKKRSVQRGSPAAEFPLMEDCFNDQEILAAVEVLLSGQLTMASKVAEFEGAFAKKVGVPHAVMVNSGSSANLLAVAAAVNPLRKTRLMPGDEVLLPAVCWSTSLWPLVQLGLKPVFVDVDPRTLNMNLADAKTKVTSRTKGLFTVHVMGNSPPMREVQEFVTKHHLVHLEDTCESFGSTFAGRPLGTVGAMGAYSFYYSHHLTTGEGGMVVCQTQEDADLLKCLRAHGWTRNLSNRRDLEGQYAHIDSRFLFVNSGFNLRPMEIQAAIGLVQLEKIDEMNANRVKNYRGLVSALKAHPLWQGQFEMIEPAPQTEPIWFGFCALLAPRLAGKKEAFLRALTEVGVENRPIVSGNFVRQPALKLYGLTQDPAQFPGAEEVDRRGFFVGLHTRLLDQQKLARLADLLLKPLS